MNRLRNLLEKETLHFLLIISFATVYNGHRCVLNIP